MNVIKSNYLAYCVVYFTINIMNIYLLIYLPLYFFDVLNINRSALALTELVSKSMLILAIFMGYFFDRFAQHKKFIISISGFILFLSFFLFIVFRNVLFWYGVFLSISLATRTIIQTGMSKLMFEIVNSNEDLKKNVILISNASSSLGAFMPTILFSIIVLDFHSFSLWNSFFLIGWIISCPLLLAFFLIKESNHNRVNTQKETKSVSENQEEIESSNSNIWLTLLVYISYFLFWGSYLFGYPLSSWITSNFGQDAFKFYSSFYVTFFLFNICGFFVAKRIYRKGSEKKIIMMGIFSVVSLFLVYPYLSFPVFFFLYSIEAFIYGLVISNFLYIIIDISRRGKYENLKYQIMQSSNYLGNAIFTSLGIYLSNFYSTTSLMVISAVLVLLASVPLILKEIPYFSAN
ncbi:MAG: MFS transporter [Promethearchaeota archaeon]